MPPEVAPSALASVSAPAELKEEVAVEPKPQFPKHESAVVEAFAKIAVPVKVGLAEKTRFPEPVSSEISPAIPADVVIAEITPDAALMMPVRVVARVVWPWTISVPVVVAPPKIVRPVAWPPAPIVEEAYAASEPRPVMF